MNPTWSISADFTSSTATENLFRFVWSVWKRLPCQRDSGCKVADFGVVSIAMPCGLARSVCSNDKQTECQQPCSVFGLPSPTEGSGVGAWGWRVRAAQKARFSYHCTNFTLFLSRNVLSCCAVANGFFQLRFSSVIHFAIWKIHLTWKSLKVSSRSGGNR